MICRYICRIIDRYYISRRSGANPGICVLSPPLHPPSPLPLPPFLSLPFPSFPLPSRPVPSHPVPFSSLPSPPLRSRPPVLRLGGLGERSSSPSGSGRSPAAKPFLEKLAKNRACSSNGYKRYQYMIDRKKTAIRYLVRQSQHTVYCAMGPKSFSAVMARKTTSGAD